MAVHCANVRPAGRRNQRASRPVAVPRVQYVRRSHAVVVRAASAPDSASTDDAFCAPAFVTYEQSGNTTKLNVRVVDYQGLLNIIAWVLNGLDVYVTNAEMRIDDEGIVDDTFYVTNISGQPLSDERAADVVERVRDFVTFCTPGTMKPATEWQDGHVHISNATTKETTRITVLESPKRVGFLLEIASVLTAVGVKVKAANVRTCVECGSDDGIADIFGDDAGLKHGRVIILEVQEDKGTQLSEQSVQAVLFTLGLLLGKGYTSTVVPSAKSYAVAW